MYQLPDRINPLKQIGFPDVDKRIEEIISQVEAVRNELLSCAPDKRQATLLSCPVLLNDDLRVENEDDTYEVVVDRELRVWAGFASEKLPGMPVWSYCDPEKLKGDYGLRYGLRQRIKDFLNYAVVNDADAESRLVVALGHMDRKSVFLEFKPLGVWDDEMPSEYLWDWKTEYHEEEALRWSPS